VRATSERRSPRMVTNSPEDEVTEVFAVATVASLRRHYPVRFQRSAARTPLRAATLSARFGPSSRAYLH
jgi:hypothetical protein